jgi:hypothetical protein
MVQPEALSKLPPVATGHTRLYHTRVQDVPTADAQALITSGNWASDPTQATAQAVVVSYVQMLPPPHPVPVPQAQVALRLKAGWTIFSSPDKKQ